MKTILKILTAIIGYCLIKRLGVINKQKKTPSFQLKTGDWYVCPRNGKSNTVQCMGFDDQHVNLQDPKSGTFTNISMHTFLGMYQPWLPAFLAPGEVFYVNDTVVAILKERITVALFDVYFLWDLRADTLRTDQRVVCRDSSKIRPASKIEREKMYGRIGKDTRLRVDNILFI